MQSFDRKVCDLLGYYVYLYIDPRNRKPFYIGKGKGNRVFAHLNDDRECRKVEIIQQLRKQKQEPILEILKYGLSAKEALLVESTAIDLLDIDNLTNEVRGHGSRHGTRGSVEEIRSTLRAEPAAFDEPTILIKIARAFRYGMPPQELYDVTRSAWKVGEQRNRVQLACAVYQKIIREVYRVAGWFPKGSTTLRERKPDANDRARMEFVGTLADEATREKLIGRSVANYFPPGGMNPIMYVNCK